MNKYYLQVITGHGNVGDAGLTSFTVEADDVRTSVDHGAYRFYVNREATKEERAAQSIGTSPIIKETVAMYPINRTIIQRIEYNNK
jgi:hypothetical protein